MLGSEWLYGAIALLVGVHVVTLLYAYRKQGEPASGAAQSETEPTTSATSDDGDGTVSCPHCGARNEFGYQFCRQCVADLSSGSTQDTTRSRSQTY